MSIISIGGSEYTTTPLNIKRLKKAWPKLSKVMTVFSSGTQDFNSLVDVIDAAIFVISEALTPKHPEMTPEQVEELMTPGDLDNLPAVMDAIMVESGLTKTKSGEDSPAGQNASEKPSTETGMDSLPNSSPQE